MWICFNDGFLSVVADRDHSNRLLVRARRQTDLVNFLGPEVAITQTQEADYPWRAFVDRATFKSLVEARIDGIDYPNFKNSVERHDLHDLYFDFWKLHQRYGRTDSTGREGRDRSGHFGGAPGEVEVRPNK